MKNFFKGIGASIGYIVIYVVLTILVVIAGSIAYGIFVGVSAINSSYSFDSVFDSFNSFVYDSAMLFSLIAGVMSLFIYWLIIKAGKKTVKGRLDLIPVSFSNLWPIIPLGIFFNLFISNLLELLPIPEQLMTDYAESSSALGDEITVVMILAVVIMAPVLEEIIFRGLVMKSLNRGMPLILVVILQALAFGMLHGQIIWIAYATVLGIILGIIKARYISLYPCILFHLAFNASSFAIQPLYNILPEGIYSSILLITVSTVIIVLLGIIIFKKTIRLKSIEDIESSENTLSIDEFDSQAVIEQE